MRSTVLIILNFPLGFQANYVRLSVQYLITQQFPTSGPAPRAEVVPWAHHSIHTLVRNTSRRTSKRLDIDFRFQFNAVTISQARSSNTNFVLSDFSCDVPVPCSFHRVASPGHPRPRLASDSRDQKSLSHAHEYSSTITISTFLLISSTTARDRDHRREREREGLDGRAVFGGRHSTTLL